MEREQSCENVYSSQHKAHIKTVAGRIIHYLLLTVIAVFLMFPFVMMISRSLMSEADIVDARLFPSKITFSNYETVLFQQNYFGYLWNTVKILLFNLVFVPLSSSVCAYAFARLRFPGKELIFALVLGTMMIPGSVIQIPIYVMYSFLGLTETPWPMMLPAAFGGGAMNIFLLRQFIRNIPSEIESAAKIDGASTFRIYLTIVIPLCGPIILYVMVGTFSSVWSDFFGPLVYLTQPEKYTLAVAIYYDSLINGELGNSGLKMAAGTFMAILPAIVFLVYQRKLVDGIMIGAIKG